MKPSGFLSWFALRIVFYMVFVHKNVYPWRWFHTHMYLDQHHMRVWNDETCDRSNALLIS
jgi:hypothetical protein